MWLKAPAINSSTNSISVRRWFKPNLPAQPLSHKEKCQVFDFYKANRGCGAGDHTKPYFFPNLVDKDSRGNYNNQETYTAIKGAPPARMQGAQGGKLVQVQHCPATVTPLVKSDNPPFMTQTLRGKACWVSVIQYRLLLTAPLGGFWLMAFPTNHFSYPRR